jgi:probable HAF family extracellular repeat protein
MARFAVRRLLATSAILALLLTGNGQARADFIATDLGSLGNLHGVFASGINNKGQVVGYSAIAQGVVHAFLWSDGVMTDLGTLGGVSSFAYAINNKGQVVGNSELGGTRYPHAFLYSNGVMKDLGVPWDVSSSAGGVNDSGQVVGIADVKLSYGRAFLYSNGVMTDLGSLGGLSSAASAINNKGQVAGSSATATSGSHAFLYSNGVMTDLGTLGGQGSEGLGINNKGQVVGSSATADSNFVHPFLYSNGVMTNLGSLGGDFGQAWSINDSGQVVGYSGIASGDIHAFFYSNGVMTDLNSLVLNNSGITFHDARGINDQGQIIANATNGHSYLLTPVPVPPGLTLAGIGILCFVGYAWRRKVAVRGAAALAVLALLLAWAGRANADMLYGLSSSSPGSLYTINEATGAATFVTNLSGTIDTSFVGIDFLHGTLYATDVVAAAGPFKGQITFGSIDISTGAYIPINHQGGSLNWHGLAANEAANLLYTVDLSTDAHVLKSITPFGVITAIGTGTGIDGRGMAYDNAHGILYAVNGSDNSLYTIDTTRGTSTLVGSLGISGVVRVGLEFDSTTGILYADDATNGT